MVGGKRVAAASLDGARASHARAKTAHAPDAATRRFETLRARAGLFAGLLAAALAEGDRPRGAGIVERAGEGVIDEGEPRARTNGAKERKFYADTRSPPKKFR